MSEEAATDAQARSSGRPELPAVLLGVGSFGVAVADRLLTERGYRVAAPGLAVLRVGGTPPPTPAGSSSTPPPRAPIEDHAAIAEAALARVREVLSHTRMVAVRDDAGLEHSTPLTMLVFADLREAEVRANLWPILARIQARLLRELGPIFEAFRSGSQRNGVILPILTMPHPPGHPAREELVACVRGLVGEVARTEPRRRAIPQLYLIEDVAEFSILSEAELGQCVRNFATLLLDSVLDGDLGAQLGSDLSAALIHGGQPEEPLASFVCAVAEFPRQKLARYGGDRVALELLDAVVSAPRVEASLSEADALEQIEARAYDRADEAEKDVRAVLERYAPPHEPDPEPRWWEEPEPLLERYGPDPGDASLAEPVPPAEPPQGWLEARMREIEATWRLLQRKRFDDVVARDRAAIEQWRDKLLVRLRKRVDRELWHDPSTQSLRRSEELVSKLRRAFAEQLDEAIRERDQAKPAPPPDFAELREAHARVLDAARRKPSPRRMLAWGLLGLIFAVLLGTPSLRLLAITSWIDPEWWLAPALMDYAWATSFALGLLGLSAWMGWHLATAQLALLAALGRMWTALRDTVNGGRGSLLEYFTTRLRLSRAIARVESLLAVLATLDADAENLMLIDKAARRARGELRNNLRELGVVLRPGERDDITALLGAGGETLVEPFVGEQGAAEIVDSLLLEGRESRVHDMMSALAAYYSREDRWREELPFADLERLRAAAAPHATPITSWDPFAGEARARGTARRIAGFVRRQRRSLRAALNFTGYEELDASGLERPFRSQGEAIVPRSVLALVREEGSDEGKLDLRPGVESDRAYYVTTTSGIALSAVASLAEAGADTQPQPAVASASARARPGPEPGSSRGAKAKLPRAPWEVPE